MGKRTQAERQVETKRKKVKLQNKATEEIKVLEIIQRDSVQGFWCIEEDTAVWEWYPHDKWKEIK
jgi:hypothetical protein